VDVKINKAKLGRPTKYKESAKRYLLTLDSDTVKKFDDILDHTTNRSAMVNTLMRKYIDKVNRKSSKL